jgi:integrase
VSARRGARVLGPYEHPRGWQVVEIDATGKRSSVYLDSELKATRYVEAMTATIDRGERTTEEALTAYRAHLVDKGNKPLSIQTTVRAVEMFFPEAQPLALLSAKRCAQRYEELRTTPRAFTGAPPSVDTHRNVLGMTRTFLEWCVKQGWIAANPLAGVEGIGRRRPRGKSLGKSGNELRVKGARLWYQAALALANAGDLGATAALVAMLLGMRASEIVARRVSDLDEDQAPADLLWIPCSKTPAGRRTLEVPDVLRPLLVQFAEGKAPERYLFEIAPGRPHDRNWIRDQVHRICDRAQVPRVTAHAMRGLLATLTAERGMAGRLIAATLGHEDERITMTAYARPGAAAAGVNRRGLVVLEGGAAAANS